MLACQGGIESKESALFAACAFIVSREYHKGLVSCIRVRRATAVFGFTIPRSVYFRTRCQPTRAHERAAHGMMEECDDDCGVVNYLRHAHQTYTAWGEI